ncbi:MAG: thermosome subunit beta [Candidatus Bathyarchaeia archaeon]
MISGLATSPSTTRPDPNEGLPYKRTDVRRSNIHVALLLGDIVRPTLGPKGSGKLYLDYLDNAVPTRDGMSILEELEVQDPVARLLVKGVRAHFAEIHDGTKTAILYASELLRHARNLLDQGLHPVKIIEGYKRAYALTLDVIRQIGLPITGIDSRTIDDVVFTTVRGADEDWKLHVASLAVRAIRQIAQRAHNGWTVDLDKIKIVSLTGGAVFDSFLIEGLAIDKEILREDMPQSVERAKILLTVSLQIKQPTQKLTFDIRSPSLLPGLLRTEADYRRYAVRLIKQTGANVVFCHRGVDNQVMEGLARVGVLAVRRVKWLDMARLVSLTGARLRSGLLGMSKSDLGRARRVFQKTVGQEKFVYVEGQKANVASVFMRGGFRYSADNAEKLFSSALEVASSLLNNGALLGGGGAFEMCMATRLRQFSRRVSGKEQMAIDAFASSLEDLPKALVENSGLNPQSVLGNLRKAHSRPNSNWFGFDARSGELVDTRKKGILESAKVKKQALATGMELAITLLRVDDILLRRTLEKQIPAGHPRGPLIHEGDHMKDEIEPEHEDIDEHQQH